MTNVEIMCPHQIPAVRECAGCTEDTDYEGDFIFCAEGVISARVHRDSDGDEEVINGVGHFWAVDEQEVTCLCDYSEEELQGIMDDLIDNATDHDEPTEDDLDD